MPRVSILFSYLNDRLEDGLPCYLSQAKKDGKSVRTMSAELQKLTHLHVSKSSVHRWVSEL